jgi:hypothetical protein
MWKQVKHQTFLPDSRLFHALVKGLPADRLHDLMDVFWFMKTQQHRVTPFIYARVIDSLKGAQRDDEVLFPFPHLLFSLPTTRIALTTPP